MRRRQETLVHQSYCVNADPCSRCGLLGFDTWLGSASYQVHAVNETDSSAIDDQE